MTILENLQQVDNNLFEGKNVNSLSPRTIIEGWRTWIERRRRSQVTEEMIQDESVVINPSKLLPLKDVIYTQTNQGHTVTHDVSQEYVKIFNYLEVSRGAEFNSERTKFLEKFMREMLVGESYSGPVRLVILNRTKEVGAQVYPDGTVVLTQALINNLESLDEVLAVLAHELGHLIHNTFKTKSENPTQLMSLAWVHESAADSIITPLLEKVGVNSLAASNLFLKLNDIDGNKRGVVHQSHLTRAVTSRLQMKYIPSTTSHKELTPLPEEMVKPEQASNIELSDQVFRSKNVSLIVTYLHRLHPDDRQTVFKKHVQQDFFRNTIENHVKEAVIQFLQEKLKPNDAQLLNLFAMFLFNSKFVEGLYDNSHTTYTKNIERVTQMTDLIESGKANEWWTALFGTPFTKEVFHFGGAFTRNMTDLLSYPFRNEKKGIVSQLTNDDIVNVFKCQLKLEEVLLARPNSRQFRDHNKIPFELEKIFLNFVYLKYMDGKKLQKEGISHLAQKLQQFDFRPRYTMDEINSLPNHAQKRELIRLLEEIFNVYIYNEKSKPVDKFKNVDDFIAQMESAKKNYTDPYYFKNHFSKNAFEFSSQIKSNTNDDVSPEVQKELIDIGRGIIEWIKKFDLSHFSPNPVEVESLRLAMWNVAHRAYFEYEQPNELLLLIENMMQSIALDVSTLSHDEIFSLIHAMRVPHYIGYQPNQVIFNTDKLYGTRLFKALERNRPKIQATTPENLFQQIDDLITSLKNDVHPFKADVLSYWMFSDVAEQIVLMLPKLGTNDIPRFLRIFKYLPSENQTIDLKKKLLKKYISPGSEATLDQKIDFLIEHQREMGYEDVVVICEQIHDFNQFINFYSNMDNVIQEFISGKKQATDLTTVDIALSCFDDSFDILNTIDPKKSQSSTDAARYWLRVFRASNVRYRPPAKIVLEQFGDSQLSLKDIFLVLKDLDPMRKSAIALRLLADVNSPLTKDQESKEELTQLIIDSFEIKNPFVRLALEGAIKEGRTDYVALQVSQLVGPLLFRNLSVNRVNYEQIVSGLRKNAKKGETALPEYALHLNDIFTTNSENLFELGFGDQINRALDESSQISKDTLASQQADYDKIDSSIRQHFKLPPLLELNEDEIQRDAALSEFSNNEAIINAMERGGALFVRCLQIASQLFSFEASITKRLANTLDQAEKMDAFRFWTALKTYTEKYPTFKMWMNDHFVRLEGVIGGGSLYTTYAVVIRKEGQEVPAVLKLLKPNSEAELHDAKEVSLIAIDNIISKGSPSQKKQAELAKRIVSIAFDWCKDDINDATYPVDDKTFTQTIDRFNQQRSGVRVEQSENYFVDTFAMCESRFTGRTLNSFIQDDSVSSEKKAQVYAGYEEFLMFHTGEDVPEGEERLSHSDPHLGNYQLLSIEGDQVALGMMDRRLYIHDTARDREVITALRDEDYTSFLTLFVSLMCEQAGKQDRTAGLLRGIKFQLFRRKMHSLFTNEKSFIDNFNVMLSTLENNGVAIPYKWQLRIRNEFIRKRANERLEVGT